MDDSDLPVVVRLLLPELEPVDDPLEEHAPRIFERVLTSGSIDAMRWLLDRYEPARIAAWYHDRGVHRVNREDVLLWKTMLRFDVDAL